LRSSLWAFLSWPRALLSWPQALRPSPRAFLSWPRALQSSPPEPRQRALRFWLPASTKALAATSTAAEWARRCGPRGAADRPAEPGGPGGRHRGLRLSAVGG